MAYQIYNKSEQAIQRDSHVDIGDVPVKRVTPVSGLVKDPYDYVSVAYPTSTTETYTFKTGGSGGTTVATVTLTYTDSSKADLSTVETA